jgi:hypothetical protein
MDNRRLQARLSVEAQERMFRLAERDFGLSIAILSAESGIPASTLRDWKGGATMPLWAAGALAQAGLPDYLLSLPLRPYGRVVATETLEDAALHEAAEGAAEFAQEYLKATSPASESGPDLSPREKARLGELGERHGAKLRSIGSKAA